MTRDLQPLLDVGVQKSVAAASAEVFGEPVSTRTALRWANAGRNGVRLPTTRGPRRVRLTTTACLRAWLRVSSGTLPEVTAPARPAIDAKLADAVLASFGLGRREVAQA